MIFLLGTLLAWAGWGLAFYLTARAASAIVVRGKSDGSLGTTHDAFRTTHDERRVTHNGFRATHDERRMTRAVVLTLLCVVALCGGYAMTSTQEGIWRLPIVWLILPFSGWAAIACALYGAYCLLGVPGAFAEERMGKQQRAGFFGLAALAFLWLGIEDPDRTHRIVQGSIPLSPWVIGGALLAVFLGSAASIYTAEKLKSRQAAKGVLLHAGLLAGSIVFCVPLFYLLSTSFKEDRDMSSPEGMIWIPKVQRTVPFFNPKEPLYEGSYQGRRVEGVIIQDFKDGRVRVDIGRPFALRGTYFDTEKAKLKEIPRDAPLVRAKLEGLPVEGQVIEEMEDGRKRVLITSPTSVAKQQHVFKPNEVEPIRDVGLRWQNYTEALEFMPPETQNGWMYLRNTLIIVIMSVIGTVFSSSIVAYAFSRMRFPWRNQLFFVLLCTMMLPGAVTMMPKFLIFRSLGWVDTLYPLWAPAFFASAFNVFMLRQFFKGIPMELEDAAKMDGCSYVRTFWSIMMPQIMPALSVIFIWTFTAAWNDFQGPLIYINSPENMPLSYALQLFSGDRSGEPGLMMAFATMTIAPIMVLFFAMQRYFIEGVTLSGFGGR